MNLEFDPYEILGVSKDSSLEEITKAYKTLVKQFHPDLHDDNSYSEFAMKQINMAYEYVLREKSNTASTAGSASETYSKPEPPHPSQAKHTESATFWSKIQEHVVYMVRIPYSVKSISIPRVCVTCLKPTSETTKVLGDYAERLSFRQTRTTTYKFDFGLCRTCKKTVSLIPTYNSLAFYFKNKDYAQLFAEMNYSQVEEKPIAKQVGAFVANTLEGQYLFYLPFIIVFLLCVYNC